ncbi:MAG: helix-turn-helix domain-containing protein [Candidatus Sericytochromatia bacterium]
MKHISILALNDSILGSVVGPHKVFTEINNILVSMGSNPIFDVKIVGLDKKVNLDNDLFTINTHLLLDEVKKTDLIIIPAMYGDLKNAIELNKKFIPWIIEKYKNGTEVASFCVGAFLLASTGLLDGKTCSTHWVAENEFKKMFPKVKLVTNKIITDENGIYSSGGAFSFLNLLIYLVEKYAGKEIAILASKIFQIEIERMDQSPFMIFNGQKEHEDNTIKQIQDFIEKNYNEKFSVDDLASKYALSRRSLERRFKKATSNSIIEYIQRVKIESAKMILESSKDNVNEIMYKTGYSDIKSFRNIFKKITGLSPLQYRNKYTRIS